MWFRARGSRQDSTALDETWALASNKPLHAFALLWMSYSLSFGDSDSGHNRHYHFSFNLSNNTVSVKLGTWWAVPLIKCPWRETVGVLLPHFLCLLVTQLLDISHTTFHMTGSGQWTVHTSDSWHLQWSWKSLLYLPVAGGSQLKGQRNLKPTNRRTLSPWMTVGQKTHSHQSPHWTMMWSEK